MSGDMNLIFIAIVILFSAGLVVLARKIWSGRRRKRARRILERRLASYQDHARTAARSGRL